eukprot:g2117.t1
MTSVDFGLPQRLGRVLQSSREVENLHIAFLLSMLGCRLNGLELHNHAELIHRRALCIGIKLLGSDHPDLVTSMEWLAYSLYKQCNFKEAVLLCFSTVVLVHEQEGQFHPKIANCYYNLAMIVEAMGLFDHAHVLRVKGFTLLAVLYPHQHQYWWSSLGAEKSLEFYPVFQKQEFWNYQGSEVFLPSMMPSYQNFLPQRGGGGMLEDHSLLYSNGSIATY